VHARAPCRIAPHCAHAPLLLLPRLVPSPKDSNSPSWQLLDPRGAFLVQVRLGEGSGWGMG